MYPLLNKGRLLFFAFYHKSCLSAEVVFKFLSLYYQSLDWLVTGDDLVGFTRMVYTLQTSYIADTKIVKYLYVSS